MRSARSRCSPSPVVMACPRNSWSSSSRSGRRSKTSRASRSAVAALRRQGVRIALDDIGAGNAGLRLLSEVDFDIMKIDLSLVRAGATHEPSEAVLRALGSFARQRGHQIVAEGIETPDLLEAVLELNYDAGQGYLFGRPGPTMAMAELRLVDLITDDGRAAHPAA